MISSATDRDFFRGARLSTLIPADTTRNVSELIEEQEEDPDGDALLPLQKQRDLLFFGAKLLATLITGILLIRRYADELLTLYIVLKLSIKSAESLEAYVSEIELKLDVWSVNSPEAGKDLVPPHETANGSQRELIFSDQVKKSEDPILIIREDEDDSTGQLTAFVLWETSVTLSRPRVRFVNAAIMFVPSGTYTPAHAVANETTDRYLPSFVAPPVNILDPLKALRGLEANPPYLAASRLDRVLPHAPISDTFIRLSFLPSPLIRVIPAMIARLRCSRTNSSSAASSTTIASLEVEIIPFIELHGTLEQVEVSLANGSALPLLSSTSIPSECRSRDFLSFLYRLEASQQSSEPVNTGNVSVSLILKIHLSVNCTSTIKMDWTTTVDLSPSLNPSFGPPSQPIQRPQRPSSLPLSSTTGTNTPKRFSTISTTSGLIISFTAPTKAIRPGEPFLWTILVVNNTAKPAKLAVIPLPRIQYAPHPSTAYNRSHAPKTSNASFHPSEKRHTSAITNDNTTSGGEIDLAQAVCDENIVYAMQHAHPNPADTDLISLTAEIRIGPLGPGACHECEIKMLALRKGAMKLDAVRVVDLVREAEEGPGAMGVVTDIRELPDVIIV